MVFIGCSPAKLCQGKTFDSKNPLVVKPYCASLCDCCHSSWASANCRSWQSVLSWSFGAACNKIKRACLVSQNISEITLKLSWRVLINRLWHSASTSSSSAGTLALLRLPIMLSSAVLCTTSRRDMPGFASARAPRPCWHSAGLALTSPASSRRGQVESMTFGPCALAPSKVVRSDDRILHVHSRNIMKQTTRTQEINIATRSSLSPWGSYASSALLDSLGSLNTEHLENKRFGGKRKLDAGEMHAHVANVWESEWVIFKMSQSCTDQILLKNRASLKCTIWNQNPVSHGTHYITWLWRARNIDNDSQKWFWKTESLTPLLLLQANPSGKTGTKWNQVRLVQYVLDVSWHVTQSLKPAGRSPGGIQSSPLVLQFPLQPPFV